MRSPHETAATITTMSATDSDQTTAGGMPSEVDRAPTPRRRVVIVASWYPTRLSPVGGIFVQDQAVALAGAFDVAIIAPIELSWRSPLRAIRRRKVRGTPLANDPALTIRPLVVLLPWAGSLNERSYERAVAQSLRTLEESWGRPDLLNAHIVLPAGLAAVRISRRTGVPAVLTEHSGPFQMHLGSRHSLAVVTEALDGASRVIAVSSRLRDEIRDVRAVPVDIVGNVVAPGFFEHDVVQPSPHKTIRVLSVGYFVPEKRFDLLLEAVARARDRMPQLEVVLVGEGKQRASLRRLAARLGVSDLVRFSGFTTREGLRRWLEWTDALVSSSDHESFGLVVAEALAVGRPVITTASGGPQSFVNDRVGITVPRGDPHALADALTRIPAFLESFDPHAARRAVEARFGPAAFVEKMGSIYEEVIAAAAGGRSRV